MRFNLLILSTAAALLLATVYAGPIATDVSTPDQDAASPAIAYDSDLKKKKHKTDIGHKYYSAQRKYLSKQAKKRSSKASKHKVNEGHKYYSAQRKFFSKQAKKRSSKASKHKVNEGHKYYSAQRKYYSKRAKKSCKKEGKC